MKITRTSDIQATQPVRSEGARTRPQAQHSDGGPTKASLSEDGAFVSSVRSEAKASADIRPEKVAEAKAMLAGGSLETSVNMDAMVNSLMADL